MGLENDELQDTLAEPTMRLGSQERCERPLSFQEEMHQIVASMSSKGPIAWNQDFCI